MTITSQLAKLHQVGLRAVYHEGPQRIRCQAFDEQQACRFPGDIVDIQWLDGAWVAWAAPGLVNIFLGCSNDLGEVVEIVCTYYQLCCTDIAVAKAALGLLRTMQIAPFFSIFQLSTRIAIYRIEAGPEDPPLDAYLKRSQDRQPDFEVALEGAEFTLYQGINGDFIPQRRYTSPLALSASIEA